LWFLSKHPHSIQHLNGQSSGGIEHKKVMGLITVLVVLQAMHYFGQSNKIKAESNSCKTLIRLFIKKIFQNVIILS